MTAPTQAQIEAAGKAIRDNLYQGWPTWETIAKIALTAAAEVEPDPVLEAHGAQCIAATIERCAQVADDMQLYTAWDIAAAIRALATKD